MTGAIVAVHVIEGQKVKIGDPLFDIDPEPYEIALALAKGRLDAAKVAFANLKSSYVSNEDQIKMGQDAVNVRQADYDRKNELATRGSGTSVDRDTSLAALIQAKQILEFVRNQQATTMVKLGGSLNAPIDKFPEYMQAKAGVDDAERNLRNTKVLAPIDGVATQVTQIELGRVAPAGQPVFAIVADKGLWVDANPKESDMTYVREGQPATVTIDAFPGREWKGTICSIAPGTGAQFSILPPQNASGNWVKVVQRVPLRFCFGPDEDTSNMRAGMSAYLSIDTGRVRTLKGVLDDVAETVDGLMGRTRASAAARGASERFSEMNPPLYETITPGVKWALTVCIMMATVMQALDTTIANVALPYMQGSLATTQDQVNWVLTSYIVAAAIMTSPLGWMATRVGRKKLFIICTAGFTVASMLCGVALSIEQMVAYRVLQGVFGAALVPLSQAVMLDIFPPARRGSAMAIWGMGVMLGPIMGPTLGGWLTDSYSWRWVFFVNLPFGILTTAGLSIFMSETPTRRDVPFSWFGFLSLSLGIGSLQMMLDRGEQLGWFDSTEILVEAILSIVGFYFFLADSFTSKRPFITMRIFRDWNFSIALVFMFLIGIILLATMALVTPFIQNLLGYPVLSSGFLLGTRGIGTFVAMFLVGRLSGKVDARLLIFVGLVLATASLWQMVGWSLDVPAQHDRDQFRHAGLRARLRVRAAQHHRVRELPGRVAHRGHGAVDADPQHRLVGRHLDRDRRTHQHDDRISQPARRARHAVQRRAAHAERRHAVGNGAAAPRNAGRARHPAGGRNGLFQRLPAHDAGVARRFPAAGAAPVAEGRGRGGAAGQAAHAVMD